LANNALNSWKIFFQKYHIRQVSVSTAFTHQPSVWVIEASRNEGKQYNTLVYLVSHSEQCASVFGFNLDDNLCIVQEPVKNGSSEKVRRISGGLVGWWVGVSVSQSVCRSVSLKFRFDKMKYVPLFVFQGCGII
jgi:hypothetical protein